MVKPSETKSRDDSYDLSRFTKAQRNIYDKALSELKNGKKESDWMEYIFPRIYGLEHNAASNHYAIRSIEEARQYLDHPVLGKRLLECVSTILKVESHTILEIFSRLDSLKLKSSMTLFACIANRSLLFARVLDKYFNGERDIMTLQLFETIRER